MHSRARHTQCPEGEGTPLAALPQGFSYGFVDAAYLFLGCFTLLTGIVLTSAKPLTNEWEARGEGALQPPWAHWPHAQGWWSVRATNRLSRWSLVPAIALVQGGASASPAITAWAQQHCQPPAAHPKSPRVPRSASHPSPCR